MAVDSDLVAEAKSFLIQLYDCPSGVGYLNSRKNLIADAFAHIEAFSKNNSVEDEAKVVRLISLLHYYVKLAQAKSCTARYSHGVYQNWNTVKIKLVLKFENDFLTPAQEVFLWNFVPIEACRFELIGSLVERSLQLLRQKPETYGEMENIDAIVHGHNSNEVISNNHLVQEIIDRNRMSMDGNYFLVNLFLFGKIDVSGYNADAAQDTKELNRDEEDPHSMDDHPGTIMSREPFFGSLYKMLAHRSQLVAESCWSLIVLLPTGKDVVQQLTSPETIDWKEFLNFKEMVPSQLYYRLLGIWRFISTANYNTPNVPPMFLKQSKELDFIAIDKWRCVFLIRGGIEMLEKSLSSLENRSSKFHQRVLWLSVHIFTIYLKDKIKFLSSRPDYYEEEHLLNLVKQYMHCANIYGVQENFSFICERLTISCMVGMKEIFSSFSVDLEKLKKICGEKELLTWLNISLNGSSAHIRNAAFHCIKTLGEEQGSVVRKQLNVIFMAEYENVDEECTTCLHFFLTVKEIYDDSLIDENRGALKKFICTLASLQANSVSRQYVHGLLLAIETFIASIQRKGASVMYDYELLKILTETLLHKCLFEFSGSSLCTSHNSRKIAYRLLHEILAFEYPSAENLTNLKMTIFSTAASFIPRGLENAPITTWSYVVGLDKRGANGSEFAGLDNQGLTCYINSLIQQFFMVEKFRDGILSSQPISQEDIDGVSSALSYKRCFSN